MEIEGTGITQQKASGKIVRHEETDFSIEEKSDKTAEDEKERFESAKEEARSQLEEAAEKTGEKSEGDEGDIFKAQIQFLEDPQITSGIEDNIEEGITAEAAVRKGFEDPISQLESQEGRMKERADDLRDVRDRLISILVGEERTNLSDIPDEAVIVAENLKPSDTSEMDRSKVEGLVTAKGSRTSHVAILSKSMGIPAVVGTGTLEGLKEGEEVLVDGENGNVVVDPSEEQLKQVKKSEKAEVIRERVATGDGKKIEVAANVANHEEVKQAAEKGADGIGLYRTEFMFLDREQPPTEEEHYENYVDALDQFPDDRVIVRTMDIGGDKPVPYLDLEETDNPFLGKRGIRLAFDSEGEELFDTQMKALLRAAASENGSNLGVMFPMVSSVEEFDSALEKVEELEQELEEEEKDYARPELGLMVETPSTVQMAGELAERADFLSIGTNDLTQYTMAASRTDSEVAELQNPLYPSVLRSIKQTVEKGRENDAWVGMCGEMAGNPQLTELLVGLGLDELSMSSGVVPGVKSEIKEIEQEKSSSKAEEVLQVSSIEEVKDLLD
ncbi:phosphoenolpyruvate--protein phosphotransferase [Candidatus Nanohaloarchaea archaeon]|nr:phosphoenolpyruvate--protein phosphotransferase [Candidatus Nanohaloarchaea archaeon]